MFAEEPPLVVAVVVGGTTGAEAAVGSEVVAAAAAAAVVVLVVVAVAVVAEWCQHVVHVVNAKVLEIESELCPLPTWHSGRSAEALATFQPTLTGLRRRHRKQQAKGMSTSWRRAL